jgi:hypothetical protein
MRRNNQIKKKKINIILKYNIIIQSYKKNFFFNIFKILKIL